MTDLRTVAVRLKAETASYQQSMRQAARDADKVGAANTKAQRNTAKWTAVGVASKAAGVGLGAGLLYAANAASTQEQALGSLQAVFKTNSAAMEAQAKAATRLGLSTTDYATAAAQLGAQLGNLGIDQKDLASTTTGLMDTAADMAAQFGGTTAQAVDALTAAFRGERDPIERYGVSLNEAGIKAEMAATGLDKTQATMSLLNKQLGQSGTVGAAAREFDTMAASSQRAQAEFDNAVADLGDALLPALSKGAQVATDVLSGFNALPEPMKNAITWVGAVGAALLIVGPRARDAFGALSALAGGVKTLAAGGPLLPRMFWGTADALSSVQAGGKKLMSVLTSPAFLAGGPVVAGLGAIALGAQQVGDSLEAARPKADEFLRLLQQGQDILDADPGAAEGGWFTWGADIDLETLREGAELATHWTVPWSEQAQQVNAWKASIKDAAAAIDEFSHTDPSAAATRLRDLYDVLTAAGWSNDDINTLFGYDVQQRINGYSDAASAAADATRRSAHASNAAAEARIREKQALAALKTQLQSVIDMNLAYIGSSDALIGQENRLAKARRKNGDALTGNTRNAAANRAALGEEVTKIQAVAQATYDRVKAVEGEEAAQRAANRVRVKGIRQLRDNAEAAGYSKREIDAYIDSLRTLPGPGGVKIPITMPGLNKAQQQVHTFDQALKNAARTWGSVKSGIQNLGWGFGAPAPAGKAAGGPIEGPGTATSDSIVIRASRGEWMMNAKAVDHYGPGFMAAVNARRYATGGPIPRGRKQVRTRLQARHTAAAGPWRVEMSTATKATEKWQIVVDDFKDKLADLRQEADQFNDSVVRTAMSGNELMDAFDFGAAADAARDLADATDAVADAGDKTADAETAVAAARRKLVTAAPQDRAQAEEDLADARRGLADANLDLAAAEAKRGQAEAAAQAAAPTPENIIAGLRAQQQAVEDYRDGIADLVARGLDVNIVEQLAGTDPAKAAPMLAALRAMTAEQLAQVQAIEKAKADAAKQAADYATDNKYAAPIQAAVQQHQQAVADLRDSQQEADRVAARQPASVKETAAAKAAAKAQQRLAVARRVNGKELTGSSKAAKANRTALEQETKVILTGAKAVYDRVKATQGEAAAQAAANRYVDQYAANLLDAAQSAGLSREETKSYIAQVGLVPGDVSVNWEQPGMDKSLLDTGDLSGMIAAIPPSKETVLAAKKGNLTALAEVLTDLTGVPIERTTLLKAQQGDTTAISTVKTYLDANLPGWRTTSLAAAIDPLLGSTVTSANATTDTVAKTKTATLAAQQDSTVLSESRAALTQVGSLNGVWTAVLKAMRSGLDTEVSEALKAVDKINGVWTAVLAAKRSDDDPPVNKTQSLIADINKEIAKVKQAELKAVQAANGDGNFPTKVVENVNDITSGVKNVTADISVSIKKTAMAALQKASSYAAGLDKFLKNWGGKGKSTKASRDPFSAQYERVGTTRGGARVDLGRDAHLGVEARGIDDAIAKADAKLRRDWAGREYDAVLSAHRRGLDDAMTAAVRKVDEGWSGREFDAAIKVHRRGIDDAITAAAAKVDDLWSGRDFHAALRVHRRGIEDTINDAAAFTSGLWESQHFYAKLRAKPGVHLWDDLVSASQFLHDTWEQQRFWAKLRVEPGAHLGDDIDAIRNAIAWGLNVPPISIDTRIAAVAGKAAGGYITGPGTATSDSIVIRASRGEFMMQQSSVAHYGRSFMEAVNAGRYARGGYVGGGGGAALSTPLTITGGVPIELKLDSRTVAVAQLRLRQQTGGTITIGA